MDTDKEQANLTDNDVPDLVSTYCTVLAVECKKKTVRVSDNVILGNIRDMTHDDDLVLNDAAYI